MSGRWGEIGSGGGFGSLIIRLIQTSKPISSIWGNAQNGGF